MPQATEQLKETVIQKVDLIEEYSTRLINWLKDFLPNLAFAMLTLIIGLWVIKRVARLSEKAMERRHLDYSLRTFLKSLIGIGLKVILIIMVAGMVGIQTTSFVAILGAAGLAVGLALQGSLSNFAGGVLIMIFKPYRVGDTIEVLNQQGEVKEIQIFSTILLTGDHRTVILPNGAVSNGFIINYSRHGNLRAEFEVQIDEKHSVEEVRSVLQKVIDDNSSIMKEPAGSVACTKIIPGGYVMTVKFFTPSDKKGAITGQVIEETKKVLSERKIFGPETKH